MQNFEPFLDWDAIDDEVAAELNKAIKLARRSTEVFAKMVRGDEDFAQAARTVLKTQMRVSRLSNQIIQHIYTVPVMVHLAGERKAEHNPDDESQEGIVQRCSRCASVLNMWHEGIAFLDPEEGPRALREDDVAWFDVGSVVAKATSDAGSSMYVVEPVGRDLEKHERECVALNDLMDFTG